MFSYCRPLTFSSVPAGANSQKYRRRMSSASSDTGHVSPEVSISTLSEELQELVKNVFELGKRQHKHYCETEIPKQVPRSKDRPRVWSLNRFQNFYYPTALSRAQIMGATSQIYPVHFTKRK